MNIAAFDPYLDESSFSEADRCDTIEQLVTVADVLSLHVPLTNATAGLVDKALLAAMKPGSILINSARGGLVDLAALEGSVLESRVIAEDFGVDSISTALLSSVLALDRKKVSKPLAEDLVAALQ